MRKNLLKAVLIIALIACALIICSVAIFADTKEYTVSYYSANGVKFSEQKTTNRVVVKNTPFSVQTGKTLFGWYTLDGEFVEGGTLYYPKGDVNLYEAYGVEVSTADELLEAIKREGMYVRLKKGITVNEPIVLPEKGMTVLDLNDKALTVSSKQSGTNLSTEVFRGVNGSFYIMDTSNLRAGKIIVNGDINKKYPTTAMFDFTPTDAMKKDIELRIFPSVEIETELGLINVNTDISGSNYTLKVILDGEVKNANYIVRSKGMKNAEIHMRENSILTSKGAMMFEDIGDNLNDEVVGLYISGGRLNLDPSKTIITNEPSRFGIYISGGVFSHNIGTLFERGNYVFKEKLEYPDDGPAILVGYELDTCIHDKVATAITATCTEAGTVTYNCSFCRNTVTEEIEALGHSKYKVLEKEIEITTEKTTPGEYGVYCQRCDFYEVEYFYPSPQNVYVQVMIRDEDGNVNSYPVKATMLYGSDLGERLQTFTTMLIESQFKVNQEDIVGIEIPLGVKVIAGGIGETDGKKVPRGLFYGNTHLETIILPQTLETVEEYAFANMAKLKTVKGVEYISKEIKAYAFQQIDHPDTDAVEVPALVFDKDEDGDGSSLTVNAKTIGLNAFYNARIKTLSFGENVNNVSDGAFGIDTTVVDSILTEVFVAEFTKKGVGNLDLPRKIEDIKNDYSAFSNIGSGHVFSGEFIVYANHKYEKEPQEPTCQNGGYTKQFCTRCEVTTYADVTDPIEHEFSVKTKVKGNCSMQGYTIYKCSMCDAVDESTKTHEADDDFDYNNHTFDKQVYWDGWEIIEDICNNSYYIADQCTGELCGATTGEDPALDFTKTYLDVDKGGYGGLHEPRGEHELDYMHPISKTHATCGKSGEQTLRCIHCSSEVVEEIKPTGRHSLAPDESQYVAGTCQREGVRVVVCTVCDYKKETPIAKDENVHEFGQWVTVIEATTEKAGKAERTCPCGEKETTGIPVRTDIAEKKSKVWLIVGICAGVVVIGGGIFLTLYFTVLRKSPSKSYKYKFNTLGKK